MAFMTDTPATETTAASAPANPTPADTVPPAAPSSEVAQPVIVPATESTKSESPAAATNAAETPAEAITNVMGDNADAPKVETKPEVKAETKTEVKPQETKTETPPEKAPEAKVELPTYELKFPEGVTIDKEPLEAFQKLFGEIETGKLDHKGFNEKAQALADMHVKALNESIERYTDSLVQIHDKQKTDWFEAFKKDADLGGEHIQETVKNVREAISSFGGNKDQVTELREQMKQSGYGNYVPLLRLINNMQAKINSYTKEKTGGIVPGSAPAPSKSKDYQRFYGGGN